VIWEGFHSSTVTLLKLSIGSDKVSTIVIKKTPDGGPRLAINLLGTLINKSVSSDLAISSWTALVTKHGRYHKRRVGSDDCFSDSFLMSPFWGSSTMVCLYLAFRSGSLSRHFSGECKRLSATALLSGKLVFKSLQTSPT